MRRRKIVRTWQLQNAKARLSEVIRLAQSEGPQLITRQGKGEVVVIPLPVFDELVRRSRKPESLSKFFAQSPLHGIDLHLQRDKDVNGCQFSD